MVSQEEWEEYEEYLHGLTDEEFDTEMKWLDSIGKAKKRGSVVTSIDNQTIQ